MGKNATKRNDSMIDHLKYHGFHDERVVMTQNLISFVNADRQLCGLDTISFDSCVLYSPPRQPSDVSCGVYMMLMIKRFCEDGVLHFAHDQVLAFRKLVGLKLMKILLGEDS